MAEAERRSFFRIHSEIALSFHSIDTYTLQHSRPEDEFPEDQDTLDLFNEYKRLDKEGSPHLAAVGEYNRALADYLQILNKKLDLLTQQTLAAKYLSKEVRPTHVNLSEGGIAFNSSKQFYKDSHLAVQLMFLSDYSSLACFAKVIRCEPQENNAGGFKLACKFKALSTAKQDLLGKQIMQSQLNAKRQGQRAH